MHDIRWIRENPDAFDAALKRRNLKDEERQLFSSSHLLLIDERRRAVIQKLEAAQARRNAASKEIGEAKKKKDEATAQRLMAEVAAAKEAMPQMEAQEKAVSKELDDALAQIPNLPLAEVPDGADEHGNVEHHRFGAKPQFASTNQPKQHFELGEALGMMDFGAAAKLSGARFVVLKKGLARLERALGQFMLDVHTSEPHNYTEVAPPLMVKDDVMFGTAQLPKFAEDQFQTWKPVPQEFQFSQVMKPYVESAKNYISEGIRSIFVDQQVSATSEQFAELVSDVVYNTMIKHGASYQDTYQDLTSGKFGLWLIPTAEVPLTNLVRESILDEAELPLRFTACTPCFRAEAGAAGKDTRGMIRQHQFTKVELVSITTPEQSGDEHERMLACAEEVLRKLGLHYRVMTLCTGDMGFASQKTYDIEVWLPGQNAYREISSCSVCGEFQARRMQARYRSKEKGVRHVHTLNGSGVAVGRALIAVMENYQEADGSIAVPDALQPYMGGIKKIEKS